MPRQQSGSSFSAQPARCFTIPLFLGPKKLKAITLLDSGASTCFLDEEFAKRHKIRLVQKSKPIQVEVIDGQSLLFGSVTYESELIEVVFKDHSSYVALELRQALLSLVSPG